MKNDSANNIEKIIENCSNQGIETKNIEIAGRISSIRYHGKNLMFLDIKRFEWKIQAIINRKEIDNFEEFYNSIKKYDIIKLFGDIVRSERGETSIKVKSWEIISKCDNPNVPERLEDFEERFRNRWVDWTINENKREILVNRSKIIKEIRDYLNRRNFLEVETSMLVNNPSGAQAKPFITRHNKLDKDFFLRIAPEIDLKKMITGGFEKIYEIGRVFRNEGIDWKHNPEFTTLELYCAYQDSDYVMKIIEEIIREVAFKVFKKYIFSFKIRKNSLNENETIEVEETIDLEKKFKVMTMKDSIREIAGIDLSEINSFEEMKAIAEKEKVEIKNYHNTIGHILKELFDKKVESKIIEPTFITDFPIEISPLAKRSKNNPNFAQRFELYLFGMEMANGYDELNDPKEQEEIFEEQAKQRELGNEEIEEKNIEFIKALKWGMPNTGGLGIGIERLVMVLTGSISIKEVIAFPSMKEEEKK